MFFADSTRTVSSAKSHVMTMTMKLWFIFLTVHETNYNVSRGKKQNRTKISHKYSEKYQITEGEIGKTKYKKRR